MWREMTKFKRLIELWIVEADTDALREDLQEVRDTYDDRWEAMFLNSLVVTAAVLGRETKEPDHIEIAEKFLQTKGVEIVKYCKQ